MLFGSRMSIKSVIWMDSGAKLKEPFGTLCIHDLGIITGETILGFYPL